MGPGEIDIELVSSVGYIMVELVKVAFFVVSFVLLGLESINMSRYKYMDI